jgi:hypothetical protein
MINTVYFKWSLLSVCISVQNISFTHPHIFSKKKKRNECIIATVPGIVVAVAVECKKKYKVK